MKLERAYLCLDCEEVSADARRCPYCASRAVYSLKKLLNRQAPTYAGTVVQDLIRTVEKVNR